jgi:hypothetical protein
MKDLQLPIEVRLVLRDMQHLDANELLIQLQEIADEWYWKNIQTIPCGIVNKD